MPNKNAAMKALRQARMRTARNLATKNLIKKLRKAAKKALAGKKLDEARAFAPKLAQVVDKAVKRGVLKLNTASRIKSRYAKVLKAAVQK